MTQETIPVRDAQVISVLKDRWVEATTPIHAFLSEAPCRDRPATPDVLAFMHTLARRPQHVLDFVTGMRWVVARIQYTSEPFSRLHILALIDPWSLLGESIRDSAATIDSRILSATRKILNELDEICDCNLDMSMIVSGSLADGLLLIEMPLAAVPGNEFLTELE